MSEYVPGAARERVAPERVGLSEAGLREAIAFAEAHESGWPRSMFLEDGRYIGTSYIGDKPPYDTVLGPVRPRGATNGVVIRHGRIAAAWGETAREDMTFSVAKSFLAVVAGLAVADGLIGSVDERLGATVPGLFETAQNRAITWRHLLQQTSEWEGVLWDRPDSVDHNRQVAGAHDNTAKGVARTLERPGQRWEYNDVRVNVLSLALLHRWRRPLPEVLRSRIMAPMGASDGWSWRGYANSGVEIDGRVIESVSGGGHWGGGMFIGSLDLARLGLLVLRRGRWGAAALLPEGWVAEMLTPCAANPSYGYMWWLNSGRTLFPSAPEGSVFALGAGQSIVWVDAALDMVTVFRWVDRVHCDALMARVMAAVQ